MVVPASVVSHTRIENIKRRYTGENFLGKTGRRYTVKYEFCDRMKGKGDFPLYKSLSVFYISALSDVTPATCTHVARTCVSVHVVSPSAKLTLESRRESGWFVEERFRSSLRRVWTKSFRRRKHPVTPRHAREGDPPFLR